MPGHADPRSRLAVVIPAYEAAVTVGAVIAGARAAVPGAPVYLVDDGSTDGTGKDGSGKGATVLTHSHNRGKGAALATGIAAALAGGADVVVTLDADGQHPPELIPALAAPVLAGRSDVALGARARGGPMPLPRRLSNWLSARLASRIGGQGVSDAQTGFRAFTRSVAERVRPAEQGYDYETAFLLAALAAECRVTCIPIPTVYHGARSHFRAWADSWRVARVFARYTRRILAGAP